MEMKKVWILEKQYTEEDIVKDREMLQSIMEDDSINKEDDFNKKVDLHLNRVKVGDWAAHIVSNNYYKFCGAAIRCLGQVDSDAIKAFKESLGSSKEFYSEDIKSKFRDIHETVQSSYRVIEGQVPKDCKDLYRYVDYPVKVNEGVYKYVWINKKLSSKSK